MKKIIIANWKMNPVTTKEAISLLDVYFKSAQELKKIDFVVCPPFVFLNLFNKYKNPKFKLGAQNVHHEKMGSFTGEISSSMLLDAGVKYVILGHGERRSSGETDENINTKILSILKTKITPVFCIGEKDRDQEGSYLSFIENQIRLGLSGLKKSQIKNIIIAYEPLWAIGKNATREATPEEFVEIKIFIKKIISDIFGHGSSKNISILYGGSINSLNAKSFLDAGADGLLVGRDSVNKDKLEALIKVLK